MYIYRLSFIKEEMMFKMASSVEEQRSGFQLMILCELGGGRVGGCGGGGWREEDAKQQGLSCCILFPSIENVNIAHITSVVKAACVPPPPSTSRELAMLAWTRLLSGG